MLRFYLTQLRNQNEMFYTIFKIAFSGYVALIAGMYLNEKIKYNQDKQRAFAICALIIIVYNIYFAFPTACANEISHQYLRYERQIYDRSFVLAIPTKKNLRIVKELPHIRDSKSSITKTIPIGLGEMTIETQVGPRGNLRSAEYHVHIL